MGLRTLRNPNQERRPFMRNCILRTLSLVLGGLALGILVFVLLFTGVLTLVPTTPLGIVFFALTTLLAGGGMLAFLLAVPRAERTPALAGAWLCCGQLSLIGALGTVLTSLITLLSVSLEVGLYIGVALVFAFLFLFLGGLICFLRRYLLARCHCGG